MAGMKKISGDRPAVSKKAGARKTKPITLAKASAHEIRTTLDIKPAESRAAKKALSSASRAAKSTSVTRRGKRGSGGRSAGRRGVKK
jgi:hypothetical protein